MNSLHTNRKEVTSQLGCFIPFHHHALEQQTFKNKASTRTISRFTLQLNNKIHLSCWSRHCFCNTGIFDLFTLPCGQDCWLRSTEGQHGVLYQSRSCSSTTLCACCRAQFRASTGILDLGKCDRRIGDTGKFGRWAFLLRGVEVNGKQAESRPYSANGSQQMTPDLRHLSLLMDRRSSTL